MAVIVRSVIFGLGCVMVFGGVISIASGAAGVPAGLWLFVVGAVLVIAPVIERTRYRSEAADPSNLAPGPGGGETPDAPIDARFRPTDEVFVDPTTRVRMRVLADPQSGERRYQAED